MAKKLSTFWKVIIAGLIVIYIISPIDIAPEAVLGPLGFIDDILLIIFGVKFLRK